MVTLPLPVCQPIDLLKVSGTENRIDDVLTKVLRPAAQRRSTPMRHSWFSFATPAQATLNAISSSQAVIEFSPNGTIITANQNFLNVMGYGLEEIVGQNHSMFLDAAQKSSVEYQSFWSALASGKAMSTQFKRVAKGGKEIWIQASYNPVFGLGGRVVKVVKVAADITEQKLQSLDLNGQLEAVSKSQAVIQFNLDGKILGANTNFLKALGYSLNEIVGQHHSMFVDEAFRRSDEYKEFWRQLRHGDFQAGRYKRIGKSGNEVWIQATYNPIFDPSGRVFKIVKMATDVTKEVELTLRLERELMSAATAATQTSNDVTSVASGVEELSASVSEISGSMNRSLAAVTTAVERAKAADDSTRRLSDASRAINTIVAVIQAIAEQINLLALNATIESARAGDAGKGFAVVASEVKVLARQAATATESIRKEVERIQQVSDEVVEALNSIQSGVADIKEHIMGSTSAVEEQSAATKSISASMNSASLAVTSISENIVNISSALKVR